ncbi:LPXTG cell wall anchor domain-containing protein, partial [uncultured Gemmiger sp.]|uniref:InlB B-repeat-containing protein n=1 Tax=uncultured Gemmiger sp. TaxID=1623490 RepID=UPI0026252EB0
LIDVEAPKSEVDAGAITIPADQIPAGYEVVEQKVFNNATYGWMASVYVKKSAPVKPETVTVKVRFIDKDTAAWLNETLVDVEAPKSEAEAGAITIPADKIPTGYEVVEQKVFNNATYGWMASVYVKKSAAPAKKTVHVHFFSDAVTEIGSVDINVNADATSITILDNMIPEGYALDRGSNVVEITKDQTQVSLFVSPVATPTKVTITVNMFDEANGVNGKPVKTYTVSADKDAKSITVDAAQIPTGYVKADDETFEKNVIGGKDDYVAFWIKKDAKAPEVADIHVYIKSSNNDLGTVTEKNIMLTKSELTGEYKAFALKATPKNGYHLTGWTVTADGKNVATVKADAATVDLSAYAEAKEIVVSANFEKNASTSASSTSSSSSNKTTTASNEKQVVKAAAAPANTTKVLPKTGASNVAPLLGGSLAVVALLMGYGVYGLVLRKKD